MTIMKGVVRHCSWRIKATYRPDQFKPACYGPGNDMRSNLNPNQS